MMPQDFDEAQRVVETLLDDFAIEQLEASLDG